MGTECQPCTLVDIMYIRIEPGVPVPKSMDECGMPQEPQAAYYKLAVLALVWHILMPQTLIISGLLQLHSFWR